MPRPHAPPRPVCRYYNTTPRGCLAGNRCHYLHGDPVVQKYAPYEENKRCRFFDAGYCKRGNDCWFRHVDPRDGPGDAAGSEGAGTGVRLATLQTGCASDRDEDVSCGICFEDRPALYGLLSGCSHAFCLTCIRQWRDPEGKDADMTYSGIHKTCPMCRLRTKFIVPSSRFYTQTDPRKAEVIEKYKQSMARVPCRYFIKSRPSNRFCPFGRDCFYQHANPDGTRYEFAEGVDAMITQWHRHRTSSHPTPHVPDQLQAALEVLEGFAETLATDEGPNDSGTRRALIDMHVRDMLRIMGAGPALRTLAQLERMAGQDRGERGDQDEQAHDGDHGTGAGRSSPPNGHEHERTEGNARGGVEAWSGDAVSGDASDLPRLSTSDLESAAFDTTYELWDPRALENTTGTGQFASDDFAWMMAEERRGESSGQEGCTS